MTKLQWPGAPDLPQLPFRYLFRRIRRPVPECAEIVTAYTDGQVTLRSNRAKVGYHEAASLSNFQGVSVGDFVVHGLDIMRGSVGVSDSDGAISSVCIVCRPTERIDPRYAAYAIRLQAASGFPKALARGIRDGGADFRRWDTLAELPIPVPEVHQQRQIVDYLDNETSQIDKLIEKQRELVQQLRERRSAVVNSVVTVGLGDGVERKSTGAEWLGEIPVHWNTKPLWSMFRRIKDVGHPEERMLSVFREYGVVPKDSRDNINRTAENRNIYQLVLPGWLVTNRMKAWQGSVGISEHRGIVSGHYICFAPTHSEDHAFLNLLFRSPRYTDGYSIISRGVRIGQAEINNDQYRQLPVVLPPIDEQRHIVAFVSEQLQAIDVLVDKSEQFIQLAKERRAALIAAVVTGQLGIEGVAA